MKFEVSGTRYEFDPGPEKLMGDEVILIDAHLRPGWADRWAKLQLEVSDIVVLTYLAARRAGDERPFDEFVKTIAPLTFQPLELDTPTDPAPSRPVAAPADALGAVVRGRRKSAAKAAAS